MFHIFRWKVCPYIRGTQANDKDQCIGAKNTAFWPVEQTLIQKSIYKLKVTTRVDRQALKTGDCCRIVKSSNISWERTWTGWTQQMKPSIARQLHTSFISPHLVACSLHSSFAQALQKKKEKDYNQKINHSHCSIFTKLFCLIGFLAPTFFFWQSLAQTD